jgi:hypothetical protein
MDPIARDFERVVARNYFVRAETRQRPVLWPAMPQSVDTLIQRARAELLDDLGECLDLAQRMRTFGVELVHVRPRSLQDNDLQHARVLSFIRSLQRLPPDQRGAGNAHYWRIV